MTPAMSALTPTMIVAAWALLALLAGRAQVPARGLRALVAVGLGLAIAAAVTLVVDPSLAGGGWTFAGALVFDRLAVAWDLQVLFVLVVVVITIPAAVADRVGLLLLAGVGVMLCAHAGDLSVLIVGLELCCLATAVLLGRHRDVGRTWVLGHALMAGLWWFGLALIFGAAGTTRLAELGPRVGAVLMNWGANTTQAAVDLLQGATPLQPQLEAYARDAAVTGAAPAMLLIPGLALALAGLAARFGLVPWHGLSVQGVDRQAGDSISAAVVLVRLAAAIALLRLFVTGLHAPRVVFAPYGWGTALVVLCGLSMVVGGFAAARQANLPRLVAWAATVHAGMCGLGMVAAANFYAHAGARSGGLSVMDHATWGQQAGDLAMAAIVLTSVMFVVAAMGLVAAQAAFDRGRGLVDLAGLAHRDRTAAAAVTVCLLGLAGAPPTGAFIARLTVMQAVFEDSNVLVRVALVVGIVASIGVLWAALRVIASLWSEPAPPPAAGSRWPRIVIIVAAASLLASAVVGQRCLDAAIAAGAGAGFAPGSPGRRAHVGVDTADWIQP